MLKNIHTLIVIGLAAMLVSCGDDDDDDVVTSMGETEETTEPHEPTRTVMVYVMAENNLNSYATADISEMTEGSRSIDDDDCLVAFVDKTSSDPYIIRICDGKQERDTLFNADGGDFYASDPEEMLGVLEWMMERYPADSYGLVLWGHASGWIIRSDTIATRSQRRAYGYDSGSDLDDENNEGSVWINIPTLADVLEELPEHLDFIFADCCNFQCAEVAYELRNTCDYIIGSPAEITGIGAPYETVVPALFDKADDFYEDVVDCYFAQTDGEDHQVPLSVIKTSEMESLADATRDIMQILAKPVDTDGVIYYRGYSTSEGWAKVMPDINDIFLANVADSTAYDEWKGQLDNAVIYKAWTPVWTTSDFVNFDFTGTDERYGGMSMFIPQEIFDIYTTSYDYNGTISQMEWYSAAGVDDYVAR